MSLKAECSSAPVGVEGPDFLCEIAPVSCLCIADIADITAPCFWQNNCNLRHVLVKCLSFKGYCSDVVFKIKSKNKQNTPLFIGTHLEVYCDAVKSSTHMSTYEHM